MSRLIFARALSKAEHVLKTREVPRSSKHSVGDIFVEAGSFWRDTATGPELVLFFGDDGFGTAVPEWEMKALKWKAKHHGTTRRLIRIKPLHGTDRGHEASSRRRCCHGLVPCARVSGSSEDGSVY